VPVPLIVLSIAFIAVRLGPCVVRRLRERKRAAKFVTMRLKAPVVQKSLCASCALSHIVRGYGPNEEQILCAYVFPPREIAFAVKACTDYRARRELTLSLASEPETSETAHY